MPLIQVPTSDPISGSVASVPSGGMPGRSTPAGSVSSRPDRRGRCRGTGSSARAASCSGDRDRDVVRVVAVRAVRGHVAAHAVLPRLAMHRAATTNGVAVAPGPTPRCDERGELVGDLTVVVEPACELRRAQSEQRTDRSSRGTRCTRCGSDRGACASSRRRAASCRSIRRR